MTTVAVFGATGKTGRRVLVRALAAGHHVRALVRNPAKLAITDEKLTVLTGDVLDADAVLSLSGGGLRAPQDRPKFADKASRTLLRLLSGRVLADAEGHLAVLESSGLDWTVVRGPMLTEDPGKGRYRVGWVGVNASTRISRDDLADFILTQVDDDTLVGRLPFVSD